MRVHRKLLEQEGKINMMDCLLHIPDTTWSHLMVAMVTISLMQERSEEWKDIREGAHGAGIARRRFRLV